MNRSFTRLALMVVLWFTTHAAISQSLNLSELPKVVCLGNPIQIQAVLSGANPLDVSTYRFDWGNGDSTILFTGTPVTNTATYQFPAAGIYHITVTARMKSSGPIVASYWDTVYNKPQANFNLMSVDSQCFKYNSYCFTDLTQPGAPPSLPLNKLIFAYGDGDSNLISQGGIICHHFTKGGVRFNVSMTTTDIGGCQTVAFKNVFVAQDLNPKFNVVGNPKCDTTPYIFTNQTPISASNLQWFRWEYGDDSVWTSHNPILPREVNTSLPVTDSTNRWQSFTYKYTKNGVFNPRLIIKHKLYNCIDTFDFGTSGNQLPENIVLKYDIRSRRSNSNDTIADSVCLAILNAAGVCLYNNYPLQGVNSQIQILWDFADPNANPPGSDKKLNDPTPCYKYQGTGHYFPVLYVQCPGQPVKSINFWSRIDTAQLSDTQYVPPPQANPKINTINGYFFKTTDSIMQYRVIKGNNGVPRDSLVAYWKFFTENVKDTINKYRRSQLQGYGVNIMGPSVSVENPQIPIVIPQYLKMQCGPDYPVEFTNASSTYQSNNLYIRWDFADDFAPRCTSYSVPDPSKPNGGLEPYTSANDMLNRTLGRFITGGVIYPGRVGCNFSHDTLPIHQYEKWRTIYTWYRNGHDFPPYDSSATGWTLDPSQVSPGGKKLVAPIDAAKWGLPLYSAGVTPSRIDTLAKMWPADINPNRRIQTNNPIPDPIANYYGYWQMVIPPGLSLDTSGQLKQGNSANSPNAQLSPMPNGMPRNYRGNTVIPGTGGKTLYEYFFERVVTQCYTVKLYMKDSFNNQSADRYKSFTRIDMVGGNIIIQQKTDTTPGHAVIHTSDTFSYTSTPPSIYPVPDSIQIVANGVGYINETVPVTGGSGTGMIVRLSTDPLGHLNAVAIVEPGTGYQLNDVLAPDAAIVTSGSGASFKVMRRKDILVYNYKKYDVLTDPSTSVKYIMKRDDEFFVDYFDCGQEATVQLPLAGVDAYGLGKRGKECPDLKNGDKGGNPQIVFNNAAGNPGTMPNCSQRSFIIFNYDSLLDRKDNTPCQLDGFVDWQGLSPMTGNAITPGGNTFPPFFNGINFPPLNPWTSASGGINYTHYKPAGPWPYTNSPYDRNGFVTVGVIIGSGCFNFTCAQPACFTDTIWYHNFFHFITLDANYTYRKVGGYSEYGLPSVLPSQDYLFDTASVIPFNNPNPGPPAVLYNPNGGYRQPWCRLFGKGDILEFDITTKQQDYVLADVWDWGDGIVTVDSFYTNQEDTFVRLDPSNPNDSSLFAAHTYPLARIRYEFETSTFPWTILSMTSPYQIGQHVYKGVKFDTVWQCFDLNHQYAPARIDRVNYMVDTGFFLMPVRHQYIKSSYEMKMGPGSPLPKGDITEVQHRVITTTECINSESRQIVIGVMDTFFMMEGQDYSDGILCVGQTVTFIDSIRYWFPKPAGIYDPQRPLTPGDYIFPGGPLEIYNDNHGRAMNGYPIDSIKTFVNPTKYYYTLGNTCPNGWVFSTSGPANMCTKIDTAFFERIYWDYESDGVIDDATNNAKHKFDKPGQYKVSMITRDTVGYWDTCFMYLNVIQPKAYFKSKSIFSCSDPTIFNDSSYIIDGCVASTGIPCDQFKEKRWWFGDFGYGPNDYRSTLDNPFYPYKKNGWYRLMEVVETNQGCFDTTYKDIYISGPRPRIKLLSDTLGCVPYTIKVVSYPNDSGNVSATGSTFVKSGRSDGGWDKISTQNPDTISITYDAEGVYYLTAIGYDKNPPALATCPPIIIPDTVGGREKPIRIYVKNPYHVEFETSKDKVCVGEVFKVTNKSDLDTITRFRMYTYNDDYSAIVDTTFKTNFVQDTSFKYVFYQPGHYNLVMHSTKFIENTPMCESKDTVHMQALKAKADMKIDTIGMPKYWVHNMSDSANASGYRWVVYNPDGTERTSILVSGNSDPAYHLGELDFKNDTGVFKICIWTYTVGLNDCYDSTCQEIGNTFQIDIQIPNVFTPNGDGINDVFNIKIKGEEMYELKIYNRWGGKVFETTNASEMWNGHTFNKGEENPAGVYYFILRYKLRGKAEKTVRGSVTLIREE